MSRSWLLMNIVYVTPIVAFPFLLAHWFMYMAMEAGTAILDHKRDRQSILKMADTRKEGVDSW
jgi:hypothetical protein